MCSNLIPIKAEKVKGYKVVLEKNERQYSPAMGIRYHSGELVKIPKKQIRLIDAFNRGILDPKRGTGFEPKMIGRTSAFLDRKDAISQANALFWGVRENSRYRICVYLVELSDDLMIGNYGTNEPVYAGRRMTFIQKEPY